MENSITVNGKKSTEVSGLIIRELPAVVWPKPYTGTAGGSSFAYASYDKIVSVALREGCDIKAVMNFFPDTGRVVFSNEPDLYYTYRIVDPGDILKLARNRMGSITFHVSPYKRAVSEPAVAGSGESGSLRVRNAGNIASGPTFIIAGTGDARIFCDDRELFRVALGTSLVTINVDCEGGEVTTSKGLPAAEKVVGNYRTVVLEPGDHEVRWTGSLTFFGIINYSLWV